MEIRNVVVVGGSGFIGSRIVRHLHEKHPQCLITILDTRPPTVGDANPLIKYAQADITSAPSMQEAMDSIRPQAVIHTAAMIPHTSERYGRRIQKLVTTVNVEGTRNVLRAAQAAGARAFVFTSSCSAVTDDFSQSHANVDERWPTVEPGKATMYGESKAQAEVIVHAADTAGDEAHKTRFRTCSLRPAVAFGEEDYQLIPTIVSLILDRNESPYRLGDGTNLWDTVYVGNVADAHVLAMENLLSDDPTAAGEAFFIQNNEPVSIRDLMLFVWKEFNGHVPPFQVGIPIGLGWFVGLLGEAYTWLTGKPTAMSRGSVIDATATRYASGEKARRILGYEPRVGLEEGLKRSCQEYAARLRGNKGEKT